MFSGTAQVSHQVCQFFLSVLCVFLCVWLVVINNAVVWCLLATSAIMLSGKKKRKRKMWSKKWYLKRNISCDAHLVNELLETECLEMMPSWCRQVNWRKCGIPWVNCAVLCVKDDWKRTVLRPGLLPVKTVQFTEIFHQVWRHTVKLLSLTESV
jgi:hypothetical protein